MQKLILVLIAVFFLTGCGGIGSQSGDSITQYNTIAHKDISVKVRTFWVDVDYDSRVALDPKELYPMDTLDPLKEVKPSDTEPLDPLN